MLLLVPFERWRHMLENPPERIKHQPATDRIQDIAAAVTQISRRWVGVLPCLPQALAVRSMLHRRGWHCQLRVGVARASEGGIRAHAWVEYAGEVIIGALPDLDQFTVLASVDTALSNTLRH